MILMYSNIKLNVSICKTWSMEKSSTKEHMLVPKRYIPVMMVMNEREIVQESARSMENGQARSQSAKRVS